MVTTKTPAKSPAKKPRPAVKKKESSAAVRHPRKKETGPAEVPTAAVEQVLVTKPSIEKGRYVGATGRRKTAVANVRLFSGQEGSTVNRQPLERYFSYPFYLGEVNQPLEATGLKHDFYFSATVAGGGPHAQAHALRHGVASALAGLSEEVRKVLKKNGYLTRDDRKKERKKPGLKRARRSPQWAKR